MAPHQEEDETKAAAVLEARLNNEDGLSGGAQPNAEGFFGTASDQEQYGGAYLPPPLVPVMKAVDEAYNQAKNDPTFLAELANLRKTYIGRPSPIYECKNLSSKIGGASIYLKREDLNHTGSHKVSTRSYPIENDIAPTLTVLYWAIWN